LRQAADVVVQDGAIVSNGGPAAYVPWWSFTKTVGPDSVVAVYRLLSDRPTPTRSAAAFSPGEDQGLVENRCFLSLVHVTAKDER
jgi:hypothetical protein